MYTMQFKNVIQSIESHIRKTGNGYDNSLHNKWFSFSLYLAHTHTTDTLCQCRAVNSTFMLSLVTCYWIWRYQYQDDFFLLIRPKTVNWIELDQDDKFWLNNQRKDREWSTDSEFNITHTHTLPSIKINQIWFGLIGSQFNIKSHQSN